MLQIFEEHIKNDNPDIFHGQHCWISTALLTDYNIPVVCTIHGTDLMGYEKAKEILANVNSSKEDKEKCKFYIESAEKAAKNSKRIFVISKQQEEKFKILFPFAANKVTLVRNGCDTTIFYKDTIDSKKVLSMLPSNISSCGIPLNYDKLAIFVGKFAQFKRIDLVLDAAKIYEEKMKKLGINVLTLIVGAGALDAELKSHQKELGLTNTHFVGRQGSDVVRALQNISDVFLAPSDNEPDGLVYKECMLCNNIPVGTIGGGVPDTLNPADEKLTAVPGTQIFPTSYGVLIPMNDSKALADAAMYVMNNPNKFDKDKIISYAKENYDQRKISKNVIIPIFEEVIKEGI